MKELPLYLKKVMEHNGISQRKLADASQLSSSLIAKILNGTQPISPKAAAQIGIALSLNALYLLELKAKDEEEELKALLKQPSSFLKKLI